jgi:nitroimidazol reductase NimA-like FMN-containing flavoprotein (pyridoxamine 5'-phosphate oxidase superfamily)
MTAGHELLQTDRTRLRRATERGSFDRELAYSILDEAYLAHVGLTSDRGPLVLPMTYGRIGDRLYLHGAVGNGLLRAAGGTEVCVTVTLLDGLVLARSAFHHSMNYRSLVVFATAEPVVDEDEKRAAFDAIVDQMVPGRSRVARPSNASELRRTAVLRVAIEEASVKVRGHGAVDDEEDVDLQVWAGVIPISLVAGSPVQEPEQSGLGLDPPPPPRPR